MIQINLLPGPKKKSRGRSGGGSSGPSALSKLGPLFASIRARITDPYLAGAVAAVMVSGLFVGLTYTTHAARELSLGSRTEAAVADSARYATILRERASAIAQRDSVQRQLRIIRTIDNDRFVWPHVLDEVSRALPPYTWLTSLQQTSAPKLAVPPAADTAKKKDPNAKAADTVATPALKFRIVGNTVDIQALTRFMKDLEASPFVQAVTLQKTTLVPVEGKEVTQFELDCEYQTPDPAAIQTVAVSTQLR